MVATPQDPSLEARVARIEEAFNNLSSRTLYSAAISGGGLTVKGGGQMQMLDPSGNVLFRIGPGLNTHADGSPQQFTEIFDENNQRRFALWDLSSPHSSRSGQQIYMYDAQNHLVFTTDINGGQAVPWFNVPLYPYFSSPGVGFDTTHGNVIGFANISTAAVGLAAPTTMWEGRIPYCSHPRISISGVWGPGSGATSVSYELDVGGSSVGTWTAASFGSTTQGPWDISSHLTQTDVSVQLKITAWAGTGVLYCQPLGCYLRQT